MILNLPELIKNQPKRKINLHFKPGKTSLRTELWYRNELLALVRKFRQAVESEVFFANEVNLNDSQFTDANKDFDADRFLKAAEKLSKADIDGVAKKIAQGLLIRGNAQNIQEVEKDLKRQTMVDLQGYLHNSGKVAEKLEQLTTANVQLIKSIHSQYLDKIQAAVIQAQVKGTPTKDLAKQIKEIGGVTEKRAKLIARDQSSKINAALTRARHEEMGVTQYIWSTSGDERVRDSHAENDGKIFSYDDPPPTGHPGDEINCRCVAIPYFGDKGKIEEQKEYIEQENAEVSVNEIVQYSQKIEPQITFDLQKITEKIGAKLVGLDFRLKTQSSLKRKIKKEIADGFTKEEAIKKIRDAIRYTTVFSAKDFFVRYKAMQNLLAINGYTTIVVKNTWQNDSAYKGVNTFIQNRNGDIFEMQYHTQQSFDLKNGELHRLYEKFRDLETSEEEKEKLLLEMRKLSSKIKAPIDIELIKDKI